MLLTQFIAWLLRRPNSPALRVKAQKVGTLDPGSLASWHAALESRRDKTFRDLRPDSISFTDSHFERCRFERIHSESVCLGGGKPQSTYTDCTFDTCRFVFSTGGNVRLVRCEFRDCELRDLFALDMELVDCVFTNTLLKGVVFYGDCPKVAGQTRVRKRNEFRGNDFSQARFVDVDFRGNIDLSAQQWPSRNDGDEGPGRSEAHEVSRDE